MPDIPFPTGLSGSEDLPKTRTVLKNCLNNGSAILPKPGIQEIATLTGVARGQFRYQNRLYRVASQQLLRVDEVTGATTLIGAIAGTNTVDYDEGFNHLCIIVRGGLGYTLDSSEVLTQITSPQFVPSNSVAHMNGRFIYIPTDGSPAIFSNVGFAGSIEVNSIFDAEQLPDQNKVDFNFNNLLYIGGDNSFEIFRDTGSGTVPYARLQGRIEYGYIGGLLNYADTYIFVGRERNQNAGIYAIGQGSASKMSDETIDLVLSTYTDAELSNVITNRFKWRGHDIATFAFQRDSFGFYNGNWFRLDTRSQDDDVVWQAGFITEIGGEYYTAFSDKFGKLAKTNKDYGVASEKQIIIPFIHPDEGGFSIQSIEFDISQGYNPEPGTVGLSMSTDGVLWGNRFYRGVGVQGNYDGRLVWNYPGGLGYYRGFGAIQISTTDDVFFAADKLTVHTR